MDTAAVFVDAGKVMHTRKEFNFAGLRSSAGLGFRVKTRDRVFMRVDAGASRDVFHTHRAGTAGIEALGGGVQDRVASRFAHALTHGDGRFH